jgi:hypothetical protein
MGNLPNPMFRLSRQKRLSEVGAMVRKEVNERISKSWLLEIMHLPKSYAGMATT